MKEKSPSEPHTSRATPQFQPVSRRKAAIANLVHQYVTIGLSIVNGIILVPLYLKYIDYSLYGAWLSTGSIVSWLSLTEAGLSQIVRQQTANVYGAKDYEQAGKVIGTGLFCNSLAGMFPIVIALVVAPSLPMIFRVEEAHSAVLSWSFFYASASVTMVIVAGSASAVLEGLQRNIIVCAVYTATALLGLIVTILMLVSGYGLISIPLGLLARNIIAAIFYWSLSFLFLHRRMHIRIGFSGDHFKTIRGLTGWTSGNKISYQVSNHADALVVGLFLGVDATPVYVLTKRAWDLVRLFLNRIGVAFLPSLSHLYGEGKKEKFKSIANRLIHLSGLLTIAAVSTGIALNAYFVGLWVGSELYAGRIFDLLMGLYTFLAVAVGIIYHVLYSAGCIKRPSIIGTIQNFSRIAMLFLFGWLWGMHGLLVSLVLSEMFVLPYFIREWISTMERRKTFFLADIAKLLSPVAVAACITSGSIFIVRPSNWQAFFFEGTVFLIVMGGSILLVDKDSRTNCKMLLGKVLPRAAQ